MISTTGTVPGATTTVPMIRAKYAEFFHAGPGAERMIYYAGIPDLNVFGGSTLQSERFAKSWMQEDPASMMCLLHSRPLPVLRRPGSQVSFKVVSG